MLSDQDLLAQFFKQKDISESHLALQHRTAKEDHIFVAGDEMFYSATVEDKGARKEVIFNKVKPYVDAVLGTMIQIRRKPQYDARMMDSQEQQIKSQYMNSLSDCFRKQAYMDFLETAQDREMLITGYGALDTNISYENDPDGEIAAEVIRYDDIFWDPLSKETNMKDARWIYRRKPFSKEEAEVRFEETPIEDFDAYTGGDEDAQYYPDGGVYDKIKPTGEPETDLVQVFYYQWWELVPYFRVENPILKIDDPAVQAEALQLLMGMMATRKEDSTPDEQEDLFEIDPNNSFFAVNPIQYADVKVLAKEYGVKISAVRQRRKCYYTAILTGKHVIRKFKSPDQQGFTIKFKTGNYDPTTRLWYGMVRSLKKPSEYANKALTEILYTIASNSKGGVMYEVDAVSDPRRFEQQWATTKSAVQVENGALSGGKIQPKAVASLPTGYENVYAIADGAMSEVSGVSKEFLGTATNKNVAALLESQRINQVLATLAIYFDSISLYQVEHARFMITLLRMLAQNSEGRLVKIVGEDGAQKYQALTEDMLATEYELDIREAPATPSQKEQTTQIMIDFADKMAATGQNIYPSIIKWLPISQSDQQRLMKDVTPSPEAQQAQQQAAQAQAQQQDQMNQVIAQATMAKAKSDSANALLKQASIAKVHADTARTLEEAHRTSVETFKLQQEPASSIRATI